MLWKFANKNRYAVFFAVLLFCFFQFSIRKLYGFSIFPDEFSYWAYAAEAAGCHWEEVISLGSFYSYGYSIVLLPIFLLCRNPVTAYRAAIALNFIMIGLSYGILLRILRRGILFPVERTRNDQIFAAIAILYPPVLFYAQTTMTETLLMFGYLLLILAVGEYVCAPGHKRLVLIFALNCYLYLVHMRTIGTLLVCAALLIFTAVKFRKDCREALLILLFTLLSLLAAELLKQEITAYLYHDLNQELYEINTYEGQIEKIKYIFSRTGCIAFAAGFCGKILYLGISTYGMAYWGMFRLVRKMRRSFDSAASVDERRDPSTVMCFFVAAATLAQIGVSTVYNVIPDSYDSVTFGRYHDYMTPILIVAGIREILEHIGQRKKYLLDAGLLLIMLTVIVSVYGAKLELTQSKGYFMAGMSFFEMEISHSAAYYMITLVAGSMCMCFFAAVFFWYSRTGHAYALFFCVLYALLFTVRLGHLYLYQFNDLAYQDMRVAEKAEKLIGDEGYESCITYMDYNEISAIGLIQFALRNEKIRVVSDHAGVPYDEIGERSVILLGANDPVQEELERVYDKELISGHFVLLYNDNSSAQDSASTVGSVRTQGR